MYRFLGESSSALTYFRFVFAAAAEATHRERHRRRRVPGVGDAVRAQHDRVALPARVHRGHAHGPGVRPHPVQGQWIEGLGDVGRVGVEGRVQESEEWGRVITSRNPN